MKLLTLSLIVAFQMSTFAPRAECQDKEPQPGRLHFAIGTPTGGRVVMAASGMERDLSNEDVAAILHLKGNIEITLVTCAAAQDGAKVCGAMVLHADEADYNEKTGEIETRGNVHIKQRPTI